VALGGGGGDAVASAEVASDGAARSMLAGPPVQYRMAEGVEAPATEAPAYRFVPEGDDAKARLAKVLGDGNLEVRHGVWYFHTTDQSGASVTAECKVLPDGSCEEKAPPPPPPGVPSAKEAEAELKTILGRLGIDTSSGRIRALDAGEPVYQRAVSFEPAVGGLPVQDLTTTIAFGENGRIEFANGYLGTFEKVGDYPLVGVAEAYDRFQVGMVGGDARVATEVGVPEPALDTPVASDGGATAGSAGSAGAGSAGQTARGSSGTADVAPADPAADPPMDLPAEPSPPVEHRVVEITGAEVVLTPVYPRCEGDTLFLVPSFRLQPEEIGFAVPAVEQASVVDPADSEQTGKPCPGQPGPDAPVGRPEPAPVPPDAGGREPAKP
jgi:hypothetical protein